MSLCPTANVLTSPFHLFYSQTLHLIKSLDHHQQLGKVRRASLAVKQVLTVTVASYIKLVCALYWVKKLDRIIADDMCAGHGVDTY